MSRPLTAREVLRRLGLDEPGLLDELRREGLFVDDRLAPEEAEELRVALLLMREMGVNAAGVDVFLHLRRRLLCLESRMKDVLQQLLEELDAR